MSSTHKILTVDEWLEHADKIVSLSNPHLQSVCSMIVCNSCPFKKECKVTESTFSEYKELTYNLYKKQKNIQKNIKLVESL